MRAGGVGILPLNAPRANRLGAVATVLLVPVTEVLTAESLSMWLRNVVR
ncbi:hypothetical protein PGAAJM_11450 [Kocuria varians]